MPEDIRLEVADQRLNAGYVGIPMRKRVNLDWISCEPPPLDLTPFEHFTRNVKWEDTFFGPVASWDEQLRTAVLMCLADPDPAALLWGDKQHMIYNEAYTPLIGNIHPRLQGQEPRPIFGDIWDDYEANYRTCEATGGFVSHPSLLTWMNRHGYEEECYFSFKWAPIIGKDGNLTGIYASCSDSTDSTILGRRLNALKKLAATVAPAQDFESLWSLVLSGVKEVPQDVPTLRIYSKLSPVIEYATSSMVHLAACTGVNDQNLSPPHIDLESSESYAPAMRTAAATRSIVVLRKADKDLPKDMLQEFESSSTSQPITEIAVCPIFSGLDAVAFIIVGLSPKKCFGPPYENFLRRLTEEIISSRVGVILLAEERERGRILAQRAEDERSRRLHELEQSEMKYRQFAERAPLGMVRLDTNGDVVYANATWKSIFGYNRGDSTFRPWLKKIHPDHVGLASQFFDEVCRTKGPLTIEHKLLKDWDGHSALDSAMEAQPMWLLVTGYLENDNHFICWVTDISAQKAAATALNEKMEEAILQRTRQENFIDMISHEIRNPMSAVMHCTEDIISSTNDLLGHENNVLLSPVLRSSLESAQTILYCIQHQKRIIDDVLTLSKLDADLLEIALLPVEPRKVIRKALKIFDRELKESSINLKIVEDGSLNALDVEVLLLDPNRFLQIIINLVTNGIKFTRTSARREITVRISASTARPNPDSVRFFPSIKNTDGHIQANRSTNLASGETLYLAVSVSDTGKGLSDAECQRLFNRFAQASPKTHIEYGGSGLGLFISRQITEMMNGQIGVARNQKEGCTFAFFVQTQRVVAENQKEQGTLAAAARKLRINVTHHPVTPLFPTPVVTPSTSTTPRSFPSPRLSPLEQSPSSVASPDIRDVALDPKTVAEHDNTQLQLELYSTNISSDHGPTLPLAKILVVEDNLINQKVVCRQLKARGYQVYAANHGREALDALRDAAEAASSVSAQGNTYFSIVLCDIEMPIMSGIECAREIRRLEAQKLLPGHIPLIAVTANARSMHIEKAMEAGMDDVTTKPYRMDDLVAQISHFVLKQESSAREGG